MNAWREDYEWAGQHTPELLAILARNAAYFIQFVEATPQQDMRQATDLVVVTTDKGQVAFRVRRERCNFRDVTLRYRRRPSPKAEWQGGYEVDKILAGHARAYLYAWVRP